MASIVASHDTTCALTTAGAVKCWGSLLYVPTLVSSPADVPGLASGVAQIGVGWYDGCALTTAGGVKCWGMPGYVGFSAPPGSGVPPGDVSGLTSGMAAIAVQGWHSCALTNGGGVKCWGSNASGALGDGTTVDHSLPVDVSGLSSGVAAISAGLFHTCALTTGGGVKCWGDNTHGQLGDGTATSRGVPGDVAGLGGGVVAVSAGAWNTCALTSAGQVLCWGDNTHGAIGNATSPASGVTTQFVPTWVGNFVLQSIAFPALALRDTSAGPGPLSASASSGLPVAYQSLTPASCSASGASVMPLAMGICTIAADQQGDATYAPAGRAQRSFLVTDAASAMSPRLANISTRAQAGYDTTYGAVTIFGGFALGGTSPKTVLIRARGPSLSAYGVATAVPTATLGLYDASQALIARNSSWATGTQAGVLADIGMAPPDPNESALIVTLQPGLYTVKVQPLLGDQSGIGIVDVFELDHPETPIVNLSTRATVETGDRVMIAGFIIQGNGPQTVVISATGPSLSPFGVLDFLKDPTLTLVRSSDQSIVATNDDWQSASNASAIQASGFAPADPREPAILVTLDPGAYTAIVSGKNGATGESVVGVFATP